MQIAEDINFNKNKEKIGDNEIKLPNNKTCGDCVHFKRCNYLFSAQLNYTNCDFYPIRFKEKDK